MISEWKNFLIFQPLVEEAMLSCYGIVCYLITTNKPDEDLSRTQRFEDSPR